MFGPINNISLSVCVFLCIVFNPSVRLQRNITSFVKTPHTSEYKYRDVSASQTSTTNQRVSGNVCIHACRVQPDDESHCFSFSGQSNALVGNFEQLCEVSFWEVLLMLDSLWQGSCGRWLGTTSDLFVCFKMDGSRESTLEEHLV